VAEKAATVQADLAKTAGDLLGDGAAPGRTMQRMQTRYSTAVAVQKPRKLDQVVVAVMREAEFAAESFFYGWGSGQERVEGASIGCAMAVARAWGNCAVETEVKETADAYIFDASFVDLETGFTISRSFRQSRKSLVYGKMREVRKGDMRYQVGQSKAIRNVVVSAVPKWLVSQAVERAKQAITDKIDKSGVAAAVDMGLKALGGYGIGKEAILVKLGRENVADIVAADVVDMRTAYAVIRDGEARAEEVFPPVIDEEAEQDAKKAELAAARAEKARLKGEKARTDLEAEKAKAAPAAAAAKKEAAKPAIPEATGPVAGPFDDPPADDGAGVLL